MTEKKKRNICGIVMPISAIDGCSENHWTDVQEILTEVIEEAGFEANLVSNADDVGIIHKRIIQNLYDNPIVVCDVSGKNPNVMFELGMRLAFDKPTIIVKDDKTTYSFDTSAIEHLEYPRDLRFTQIVEFKKILGEKISATYEKSTSDKSYTTFLKHFGEFKVAKIDQKEITGQEYILDELRNLRVSMRRLETVPFRRNSRSISDRYHREYMEKSELANLDICLEGWTDSRKRTALELTSEHPQVIWAEIVERGVDHQHLLANFESGVDIEDIKTRLMSPIRQRRTRLTESKE